MPSYRVDAPRREPVVIVSLLLPWTGRTVSRREWPVKKIVALVLAAGVALFVRRQQQSRPAADVWRDATGSAPPARP